MAKVMPTQGVFSELCGCSGHRVFPDAMLSFSSAPLVEDGKCRQIVFAVEEPVETFAVEATGIDGVEQRHRRSELQVIWRAEDVMSGSSGNREDGSRAFSPAASRAQDE